MILFIDTKWADVLARELVSLALVSECGQHEFYAERDPLPSAPTDFVRSVVYPLLERGHHACSDAEFTRRLHAFFESVASVAQLGRVTVAYDHRNDLDLLHYALEGFQQRETPTRPAFRAYNLGWMGDRYLQVVEECFASDPELRRRRHHARIDARANRDAFVRMRWPDQARQVTPATLRELQQQDPELANYMVETIGDEVKAWRWFVAESRPLKQTPIQAHAQGKREKVLQELYAIRYGIPS
jgi:hypothetical protein